MKWDSEKYLLFKNERTRPSYDLTMAIKEKAQKKIIDIGCGPGNSTENLYKRFPDADILGVDSSEDMLNKARKAYENLPIHFERANITPESGIEGKYDIVFSNACLHWIGNHEKLIPKLFEAVNDGGVFAVQMPLSYKLVIYDIVEKISKEDRWQGKFSNTEKIKTNPPEFYFDTLSELTDNFSIWETVYYHRMKSYEDIIDWYKGTGLRPYFAALEEDEEEEFTSEVISELKKFLPKQKNGEIIYKFPRLFFTAEKSGEPARS